MLYASLVPSEIHRQDSVCSLLEKSICCSLVGHNTQGRSAELGEGSLIGIFCALIMQFKREIGTRNTDGSVQVGLTAEGMARPGW